MATATRTRSVKLAENIYGTPTGIKVGARGKVQSPLEVLATLSTPRQVRKAARRAGLMHIAQAVPARLQRSN